MSDGLHKSPSSDYIIKLVDSGKTTLNIRNNGTVVKHGGITTINSSILYAEDNSSKIEEIFFHVLKPPVYGHLFLNHNESNTVKNFSVFDLANNLLSYKHNESAKVTSDGFDLMISNGVISKNITFNITITGVVNKIPILEVILPLHVNPFDSKTFTLSSQHLLSYQPLTSDSKIIYILVEPPKFGSIFYDKKISNPSNFSQEDISKGLISYVPYENTSYKDQFLFEVTNKKEEGYLLSGKLMLKSTTYVLQFLFYLFILVNHNLV